MSTVIRSVSASGSLTVSNVTTVLTNATVTAATSSTVATKTGWQSAMVDDTSRKSMDYEVMVKLTMPNVFPGNDKAIYVYVVPWYYDGSSFIPADWGTATLPSGTDQAATIGDQGDHKLIAVIPYNTNSMVATTQFRLSSVFGSVMPDGWSLAIVNYGGSSATIQAATINWKAITFVSA